MRKIKLILCVFLSWVFVEISGQSIIPKMKIENEKNANPMQLQELHTDIYVMGNTVVTTMEMVFYNPNNRVMEGQFEFPLADGYQVSRFALDINGKLREGVVVDKAKGRKAFEDIVRRGIDPGLLEKTEGNNFRARVYPMPAKGTRRILIAFEQELGQKDGKEVYFLPIKNELKLKKFSLKAEIVSRQVQVGGENNLGLDFKNWQNSYLTAVEKTDFVINENIVLHFPKVEKQQSIVAKSGEKSYFYSTLPIKKSGVKTKVFPKKINILWDASSSGKNRDFEKEWALLGQYFNRLGNVEVSVSTFHITATLSSVFKVSNGNWQELKQYLQSVVYDGATDWEAMKFNPDAEEYLVFTDGIFNFGREQSFAQMAEKIGKPVYVINSNKIANTDKLKYLAHATNGALIDLTQNSTEKSVEQLVEVPYRLLDIKVKLGKIDNIFPKKGEVLSHKPLVLAGELKTETAMLELAFGYGNQVVDRQEVSISANESNEREFALIRRIWAGKKMAQMRLENASQKEIDAVGQEFGIITEGTSLIVLETAEDYVRYGIFPPAELEQEYNKLITAEKNKETEKQKNKEEHRKQIIKQLVTDSEAQTKWWNTKYPLTPKKKTSRDVREAVSERSEVYAFLAAPVAREEVAEVALETAVVNQSAVAQDTTIEEVVLVGYSPRASRSVVSATTRATERRAKEANNTINLEGNIIANEPIQIQLGQWNLDTPYAKVLQYAEETKAYETYLKLKEEYGQTPSFYVDAADYFFKKNQKDIAVRVLSNLAELGLEEAQALRILGYKLSEYQRADLAINVFRKVVKIREEEPQSYRDLGLALAQNKEYNEAVKTLYKVATENWDGRFEGIRLIAMNEINQIVQTQSNVETSFIEPKLLKKEPVDVRVVLSWDTDSSDMDLWVIDPDKEQCDYTNTLTHIGGKISRDITQGYGPEEFMLKNAKKGQYQIKVNYYGNYSQKQLFPVSLKIEFFTHYGTPQQEKKEVVVRLSDNKETIDVGEFLY